MRVVYGTLIAVIIAGVALFDLHHAEEIEETGGRAQVAQRACGRIWAGVKGGNVWQALRKRPLIFALLVFLHVEILIGYKGSELLLGKERFNAVVLSAAPFAAVVPSLGSFFGSGEEAAVVSGSGCYWEKGRRPAAGPRVPPHTCTYDVDVCCPSGCEDAGGRWIWGEAVPPADNESGKEEPGVHATGKGFAKFRCSQGCASIDCGRPGTEGQ